MNFTKIRKSMTFALEIAAVGLIAAIFVLTCMPAKIESEETTGVETGVSETRVVDKEAIATPAPTQSSKLVALTFDDGPTPTVTNKILDSLEKYHARATFFVVGRQVKQAEKLVSRAANLGCEIGNHTWEHKGMTQFKGKGLEKSLQKTVNAVKKYADYDITLARPTYGSVNAKVKKKVNCPLIYWNVDTEDWKLKNAKKIFNKVKGKKVKDGDIILFHDLHIQTAKAMEKIIPYLQKEGFELVTVSELMQRRGITMKAGSLYYSAR